ncbi:fimbrial chaperone protein [Superficieibacter electus]|uniref:Fimbrial chaperone protein n=1 Tax=Superficieibacter electus TaxID=2022662 RepID=A0A2P5GW43_9ENTR|nr:fimbrial protein YehD [Superficieibacter electus]POP47773.1 fimbrial chaperone protein [Superficieibacter electus]POP50786.1 fimbrial chaperone protein [Superficieibacter electus]
MKHSIIAVSVFSSVLMSTGAYAANEDAGILEITGKVVGTTCAFIGGSTAEINLNEIGADKLDSLTVGKSYDALEASTPVPLKVKCNNDSAPTISFSTTQFDGNDITLNNGSAKGVGFAVYYGDTKTQVDPQAGVKLTPTGNGEYTLNFIARYARAEGASVIPGDVKSTLTMTVVTD